MRTRRLRVGLGGCTLVALIVGACSIGDVTDSPSDASPSFGGSAGIAEASFGGSSGSGGSAGVTTGGVAGTPSGGSAGSDSGVEDVDAGPPKPTDFTGLVLWLRSDLGIDAPAGVDTWTDQSSASHNFFQPNPALRPGMVANGINGKPVVQFKPSPGLPDLVENSGVPLPGAVTVFLVVQLDTVPGPNGFLDVFDIGVTGTTLRIGFSTSQTVGDVYFGRANPDYGRAQPGLDKEPHLYELTWDGTAANNASKYSFAVDGVVHPVLSGGAALTPPALTSIGALSSGSAANAFSGVVGELVVYDRVLAPAEQAALSAEIRAFWGL